MHFRYDELSQALDESKKRTYSFGRTEIVQSMIDDHFFFFLFSYSPLPWHHVSWERRWERKKKEKKYTIYTYRKAIVNFFFYSTHLSASFLWNNNFFERFSNHRFISRTLFHELDYIYIYIYIRNHDFHTFSTFESHGFKGGRRIVLQFSKLFPLETLSIDVLLRGTYLSGTQSSGTAFGVQIFIRISSVGRALPLSVR